MNSEGRIKKKDRKKPRYCDLCGKEYDQAYTDRFDPITGRLVVNYRCLNPGCQEGRHNLCELSGGHKYGFSLCWKRCKLCGYNPLGPVF